MPENSIPSMVADLCRILREHGYPAYPVGGCVRDLLLGRTPGDWDVTTAALPEIVMGIFDRTIPTGLQHGTVTVLMGDEHIEVTTFRREGGYADGRHPDAVTFDAGLTEDLGRRDFTINAMSLGEGGGIIDPFGGQSDLKAGLIRCVGEPNRRFAEDALRMLRAVRFAAQLGFAIEEKTAAAIGANAHRCANLSGERVKAEVEKILLSPRPELAGELVRLGLLEHLFSNWIAGADLSEIGALPPTPKTRWRWFCAATGFPIAALPTERALRRAVEHPELDAIAALAISGGELCALGLAGQSVGAMQRRLGAHIMACPGENNHDRLLALAKEWTRCT